MLSVVCVCGILGAVPFGAAEFAFAGTRLAQEGILPPDATHRVLSRGDFRIDITEKPDPLKPIRTRTEDEQRRLDAVAWFMKGRFLEAREEFKAALEAYEKAVQLDPNAAEVYRSLIPLAFGLNESELGMKYALKAVELTPDDFQLLQRIGIQLATKERVPEALKLLEQASRSNKLDRQTGQYVGIMRDLAILYLITGQFSSFLLVPQIANVLICFCFHHFYIFILKNFHNQQVQSIVLLQQCPTQWLLLLFCLHLPILLRIRPMHWQLK